MKGLLKFIAGLGVLIIVLIAAGGAILGMFFDPNEYKPEIEKVALEKGGVELKINGDIGWSVFPWLGLEVNKIDVKFPGKEDLASLNQAKLSVRLPALMSGNVEMQSIVIDGLKLNLVKTKEGATNWTASTSSGEEKSAKASANTTEVTETTAETSSNAAPLDINIDSIQITNAIVDLLDHSAGTQTTLSDFNMTSGQVVTNAFFPAKLNFNAVQKANDQEQIKVAASLSADFFLDLDNQLYKIKGLQSTLNLSGEPIAGKSLELSTQADIEADLTKQLLTLNSLQMNIANLKAEGNVSVNDFANPVINGKLSVATFDLNQLLKAVGQPAVITTDPKALSAISFNTELSGPANTVTAKTLSLKLDKTNFDGSAAFNMANGNITLNLQGDKLNADSYMPPATESAKNASTSSGKGSKAPAIVYSKDPILPIDTLKTLELDASIGLKALHVSKMDVNNIAVKVSAHGGLIKISQLDANLYSGSVKNKITVDVRKKTPVIRTQKTVSGIQIGDMLKEMADFDQLTGALHSSSNITVTGNSVHAFVNSMTGKAKVNMKDGELHGIDMAQTVCQGMNNIGSLGIDTQEVDRSTPFANMGASVKIKNGIVDSRDLKAALDAMVLSGKGKINLLKQNLDYRLGFMVEKNLFKETCSFPNKLEGVEIPVNCKGSFNTDPAQLCKPDLSFLKDLMKKEVEAKVEKEKEKAKAKVEEKIKDKLGDKLKGLF
jgi:AsmA protein